MICVLGRMLFVVNPQRGTLSSGAGETQDRTALTFEPDAQALVFTNRTIDRVAIGKLVCSGYLQSLK